LIWKRTTLLLRRSPEFTKEFLGNYQSVFCRSENIIGSAAGWFVFFATSRKFCQSINPILDHQMANKMANNRSGNRAV
jgi:hypothetical protein